MFQADSFWYIKGFGDGQGWPNCV